MDLKAAIQLAFEAHGEQKDQQGQPYILHPLRVMQRMRRHRDDHAYEHYQIVAVLHDVLEDTHVTSADLRTAGYTETVVADVECLSRRQKDETYTDFIVRCASNHTARIVKLADLEDNLALDRILLRGDRLMSDLHRIKRYVLSHQFLSGRLPEAEFRQTMSSSRGK